MNLENTCYIVGAASLDGVRLSPRPGDYVIAADGGYRSLKARGIDAAGNPLAGEAGQSEPQTEEEESPC